MLALASRKLGEEMEQGEVLGDWWSEFGVLRQRANLRVLGNAR